MQEKKLSIPLLGRVAIAADHGGFELKAQIQSKFSDVEWIDLGADSTDSVDYPDYAHKLADAIKAGQAESGILICGTGIGISIAANRHDHIRAALCTNVLCLWARITGAEAAFDIAQAFLETEFEGGRHDRRIDKINE
jgi:ribose 5-phosphate isomerase B